MFLEISFKIVSTESIKDDWSNSYIFCWITESFLCNQPQDESQPSHSACLKKEHPNRIMNDN